MNPAPKLLAGAEVVFYSTIDEPHRYVETARYVRNGNLTIPTVVGLAICKRGPENFFLFGCDEKWNVLTDSWYESLNAAEDAAEAVCDGVVATWMKPI